MDVTLVFLAIAGVFNVLLGTIILIHGPKNRANITYAMLVASLVLWLIAIVVLRVTNAPDTALLSLATAYFAGCAIAALFWHFVMFFCKRSLPLPQALAVTGGGLIISLLAFTSPDFIKRIDAVSLDDKVLSLGPLHFLFIMYFVVVMADAFVNLYREYKKRDSESERAQLAMVFAGTFITTAIGSTFNIFFVQIGVSQYISWGPVATVIMVTFLSYAIMRHNLMNIRVIGAEFFTLLLVLLLAIRLILSERLVEALFNTVSFVFAAGFGILLVRSVIQEVRNRERITELARKLENSNEELKKLDQAKSEFISIASHQLRAPLTIIKGYVSLAIEGTLGQISDQAKDAFGKVAVSANQLVKLVGDLLNLSRIEAGKIRYEFTETDVVKTLKEIVGEFQNVAVKKGKRLEVESTVDAFFLNLDPDKIREVFVNLIDNGLKYAQSRVTISLEGAYAGGRQVLRLLVRDDGMGIAPQDLAKLFIKFSRTDQAQKTDPNGLGIGLYFVKRVVEDHGGKVWAESEGLGKGSTFFVELPLQP